MTAGGELSAPFALRGVRVEDALGEGSPEKVDDLAAAIRGSGRTRTAADALAHQETLDARIREALEGLHGGRGSKEDGRGPIRFGGSR